MRGTSLARLVAVAALLLLLAVRLPGGDAAGDGFVVRDGGRLLLDGRPFRLVGVNHGDAAADPLIWECDSEMWHGDIQANEWLSRIRRETGSSVVRFWAFQAYTDGGRDWRALDRVFALAEGYGIKLMPVLDNQWRHCTHGPDKTAAWYAGGFRQPWGSDRLSYRDHVEQVVRRYAHHPAVFGWMLMNEAEARRPEGGGDPEALERFTAEMSALVKEIAPRHLVTLGVIGTGQPGVEDDHYERLHALAAIDFLTFHDYGRNDEPLPGAAGNEPVHTLAAALNAARRLNKPLVVTESGMTTCRSVDGSAVETPASRARKIDAKIDAFFAAGGAGYLVWIWHPSESCLHFFSSGDPLNAVLQKHAC